MSLEGRMVIKNLLLAQEAGLGKGETPIFPILIFKVKKGINLNEEDPNYDLFELACKVSSERLFPNFVFIDAPQNIQYYQEGRPETEAVSMGCVDGEETVKLMLNGMKHISEFRDFWAFMSNRDINKFYYSEYINLEDEDVQILDSFNGKYVKVKKLIKNPDNVNYWFEICFVDRKTQKVKSVEMTENHPLPIVGKGRTLARDFEIGDMVNGTNGEDFEIVSIKWLGRVKDKFSYDVETESDRFDVSGIQSHNCRTRVIGDRHGDDIVTGKGNLSFTTINLPKLGILAQKDINKFYELFDKQIDLCIEQLLIRFKNQCNMRKKNFPFLLGQNNWQDCDKVGEDEGLYEILKHGSLSIGFIGLAECLIALTGKHHGESKQSWNLAYDIVKHLFDRTNIASDKYDLNFSCLGTPAEGTCNRFNKILKKEFGTNIKGITDKDYVTNSFHIPVEYKLSAKDKIDLEAPFHALTPAGHISYIEFDGSARDNVSAFISVIKYMAESGIGYGSINHPVDRCDKCGFSGIIPENCPNCDSDKIIRIRRITGYLANRDKMNDGKRAEEKARVKHC